MTFLFQISVHTTIQNHVAISVFDLEDRIIVDNLFRKGTNMKSKHANGDCKNTSSDQNIFQGGLKMQGNMLD